MFYVTSTSTLMIFWACSVLFPHPLNVTTAVSDIHIVFLYHSRHCLLCLLLLTVLLELHAQIDVCELSHPALLLETKRCSKYIFLSGAHTLFFDVAMPNNSFMCLKVSIIIINIPCL
jgi:hypothetical protein